MKKPLKICIIEGPAGSGKSWLIDAICHTFPEMFRVPDMQIHLPRPRDYSEHDFSNGGFLSALKDYRNMISAVDAWRQEPDKIFLIDRMIWSQLAYGTLRYGKHIGQKIKRGYMISFDTLEAVTHDYLARSHPEYVGHEPDLWPIFQFLTVFNMPDVPVINIRRDKQPTKSYPFPAEQERNMYNHLYHWGVESRFDLLWYHEPEMSVQALGANIMMKFLRMDYEN